MICYRQKRKTNNPLLVPKIYISFLSLHNNYDKQLKSIPISYLTVLQVRRLDELNGIMCLGFAKKALCRNMLPSSLRWLDKFQVLEAVGPRDLLLSL